MEFPRGILTFAGGTDGWPVAVHAGTWVLAALTAWIGYYSHIHDKALIHNDHETYAMAYVACATLCPVAAGFYAGFLDERVKDERYVKTFVDAIVFGVVFATLVFATQALYVAPIGEGAGIMMFSVIFSCLGAGMVVVFHIDSLTAPANAYARAKVAPERAKLAQSPR